MSEAAATVANFDSAMAAVDSGGGDAGGAEDFGNSSGTMEMFNDSTGPSNDNAMRGAQQGRQRQTPAEQQHGREGPEVRVDENGDPIEFGENGLEAQPDQQEPEQGELSLEQYKEMHQATLSPDLHDYFLDKYITRNVNGMPVRKTVREWTENGMRMSDYSRGKQELAQKEQQAHQAIQGTRQLLQRMTDPRVLRATIERLGPAHEKAFHEAASAYAKEQLQLLQMSPQERQAFERMRAAERKARMLEEQARRQPEQPQQNQAAQYQAQIQPVLEQVVPHIWAKHGLPASPVSTQLFATHIQQLWDGRMETIPEAVERASIAAAEDLQQMVQRHRQSIAPQQQRQGQPLDPRRLPAGAPSNMNGQRPMQGPPRQHQRPRTTDFDAHIKALNRR